MRLRAAILDLDHTLIDFERMKRMASDAAARAMVRAGAEFSFTADEAGDILFGDYKANLDGDRIFETFLQTHHQNRSNLNQHAKDRIIAAAVNAYLEAKRLHTQPYPAVQRTLLELARRGLRMGIVTDAPRFKAYQRLDLAGLTDFFDFVLTNEDEPIGQERFRHALQRFGTDPKATLAVGAWNVPEVQAAKNLGLPVAWAGYGRPGAEPPAGVDHKLRGFGELLKIEAFRGGE